MTASVSERKIFMVGVVGIEKDKEIKIKGTKLLISK